MRKIIALFILTTAAAFGALVGPAPGGSTAVAVDPSGVFSFLHLDSSGNVICAPTVGALVGPAPGGSVAVAVDPSGNYAFLSVDSTGALLTSGGGGGGTPGGSNTQVQFNDAGSFGGNAAFTFNKASSLVTMNGVAIDASANITGVASFSATTFNVTNLVFGSSTGVLTASGGTVTASTTPALGTPSAIVLTNATGTAASLTAGNATLAANLSGTPALPNGTTATTQSAADNSTKLATTAYTDAAVTKAIDTGSVLTYNSSTMAVDFAGDKQKTITVTGSGNITLTTTNKAAFKSVTIYIFNDAATCNFTFPGWIPIGAALPASLAASKNAVLTLTSTGTTDGAVFAAYAAQP